MNFKNIAVALLVFFSRQLIAGNIFLYISLKGDDKIAIYKLDTLSGSLQLVEKFTVSGGPASIIVDAEKKHFYIAQRFAKSVSSFNVDQVTGRLSLINTIAAADDPVNLALDKTNKFLLTAYYNASKAAIYPISSNASAGTPPIRIVTTGTNPHAILTDPSNRFLYISNKTGDKIQLYRFDASTGDIDPGTLVDYATPAVTGPRHFIFHSSLPLVYFANEKGNSASVYSIHQNTGVLTHLQTITTLPVGFTGTNTVADIHMTRNEKFLYVSNRGHNSIAAFRINQVSGLLSTVNQYATVNTPRAFDIDPTDRFLFAAGETSANLATYRINPSTGELSSLGAYLTVGNSPSWVLGVEFSPVLTSVPPVSSAKVSAFSFSPNPFSNSSAFSFQLRSGQKVNITIYDSSGNPVKTLADTSLNTGKHSLLWDGADNAGNKLPAGVYTAIFHALGSSTQIKVMIP